MSSSTKLKLDSIQFIEQFCVDTEYENIQAAAGCPVGLVTGGDGDGKCQSHFYN